MFVFQAANNSHFNPNRVELTINKNNFTEENKFFGDNVDPVRGISFSKATTYRTPFNGHYIYIWGRIDNLRELRALLSLPDQDIPLEELIFAAWKTYSLDFPQKIKGNFAIAIVNFETGHIVLAKDALGTKPLFYTLGIDFATCATSIPALLAFPQTSRAKNVEWVKRYIVDYFFAADFQQTAYSDIFKVPSGHCLEISKGSVVASHNYVCWNDNAFRATKTNERFVQRHKELFKRAIMNRSSTNSPIGIENSGGLDSASIMCMLSTVRQNEMVSMTTLYAEKEESFATQVIEAANGCKSYFENGFHWDLKKIAREEVKVLGHPSGQSMEITLELLKRVAQETQIKSVFSGFGGDQVVTNMADQMTIELVSNREYRRLWNYIQGSKIKKPFRFLRLCMNKGKYKKHEDSVKTLAQNLLKAAPLKGDIDFEDEIIQKTTSVLDSPSVNHAIINVHLKDAHISNRFDTHTLLAETLGLDYQWPLWDQDLVQNYLSTPSIEKMGPKNERRYLHRRALKNLVPKDILSMNSKFMGDFIETTADLKQRRAMWDKTARELVKNMHPELRLLVDTIKLEEARRQAVKNIGRPHRVDSDIEFADTVSNLYALDVWYKQEDHN